MKAKINNRKFRLMVEEVINLVSEYFKVSTDSISANTKPEEIEGWDSLAYAEFLINIEKKFNIEFDINEVLEIENLDSLAEAIKNSKKL